MALSSSQIILLCAVGIILLARPAHAFGAGNIGSTSKIEGQNWRHGDLEDTLLTIIASRAMGGKKFSKLDVKRVYFGNWLRDYSQAVDVGTVKHVSAEAIRILLWVLGFMSFGYGTGEFEVTSERLGCYRPEEHIDNPKDYADNEDARRYDRRLRGPVDERRELSIDPQNGLKHYIASEGMGIETSAGLVRRLFGRCIELGRQYSRTKDKKDLYEALRLLGTASHCLEDYAAHSNYVELALIEMGERETFPHVGRRTAIQLREVRHPVYPIVTGTFGGVDFLHSVCGEFDDKATQSEIQELEGTLQQYQNGNQDNSILQQLLKKLPSGIFGGKDEAGKADELQQNALNHQMQNANISPRQPEEWARYLEDTQKQIYPIIQWHDEILQSITQMIEKIPILPDLIEQVQEEVNKFVFSLLAPFVVPIITQVKNELNTGSSEIIQSSMDKQHVVFKDDNSSDPTHSMLSKDHFSNVLNEPAGKVARETVKWVVPQIVSCWDDDRIDVERTLNRIINGVLHHPALRDYGQDGASDGRRLMFAAVEQWWRGQDERERAGLREQLSRQGVESGMNHKPGVEDHGHGSNRPLGMANVSFNNNNSSSGMGGEALGAISSALGGGLQSGGGGGGDRPSNSSADQLGKMAGAAAGGGFLGSLVGKIASGIGGDILGGGLDQDKQTYKHDSYGQDGSFTETVTQMGHSDSGNRYGQAQYSRTTESGSGGRQHEQYNRFEQSQTGGGGWQSEVHHQERTETGRYSEATQIYGQPEEDNSYGRREEHHSRRHHDNQESYSSGGGYGSSGRQQQYQTESSSSGYGATEGYGRQEARREEYGGRRTDEDEYSSGGRRADNGSYGQPQREPEYPSGYGRREEPSYGSTGGGGGGRHHRQEEEETRYGRRQQEEESSYGRRQQEEEPSYGRRQQEETSYGRRQQEEPSYGRRQQEELSYGSDRYERQEEASAFGGGGGYGESESQSYGRRGGGGEESEYRSGAGDENEEGYGRRQREYGEDQGERESEEYGGGYSSRY